MVLAIKGVDYSHHGFTGAQLKAAGIVFAARYIQNFPGSSFDKEMKATELSSLTAAGVRVVANWEWDANPPNSRTVGKDHATKAKARLALLHVPDWAPIYYSIDTGLLGDARNAYAQGWRDVYPADQLGVYTCGALFRQLKADGYVKYAWQSMSRSFPGNHLPGQPDIWDHRGADVIQTGNGTLLGHLLDWDTAFVADYGGFLMGEVDPMADNLDPVTVPVGYSNAGSEISVQAALTSLMTYMIQDRNLDIAEKAALADLQAAVAKIPTTSIPAGALSEAELAAIAKAVNDEEARRQAS